METKHEKQHLTLVQSNKRTRLMPYVQKLLDEELLRSIVDELQGLYSIQSIETFRSTQTTAEFSLVFSYQGQMVYVLYMMETTYQQKDLYIGFEGRDLSEALRVEASKVLQALWEKLRFTYGDKKPVFGDYFIQDIEGYYKRLEESYIKTHIQTWKGFYRQAVKESRYNNGEWDDQGTEFHIYVTGLDGKRMLDALRAEGLISVKQCADNLYQMEFVDYSAIPQQDRKKKTKFVQKMIGQGYNIWMQIHYV